MMRPDEDDGDLHPSQTVKLSKKMKAPGVFGESVLLGCAATYPYTLRSQTLCLVHLVNRSRFKDVLEDFPVEKDCFDALKTKELDQLSTLPVHLYRHALFSQTRMEFLQMACDCSDEVFFDPGHEIIRRGETCKLGETNMYVLIAGSASVRLEFGDELCKVKPGDMIGEGGSLGIATVRSASVTAWDHGMVRCLRLQGMSIQKACAQFPEDYNALADHFYQRASRNTEYEIARRKWLADYIIPVLAQCRIFKGFSEKLLTKIGEPLLQITYQPGEIICHAGDMVESMIVFLDGEAEILDKNNETVGRLVGGATIGEVAVLGLFPWRTATVRASAETSVVQVLKEGIQKVLSDSTAAMQALERLEEERRQQVLRGAPLCMLGLDAKVEDVVVRAVALHADRVVLAPGQMWQVSTDAHAAGPHLWIFTRGRAVVVMGPGDHLVNPVLTILPGQQGILSEQLCLKYEARVVAQTAVEAFRIRRSDLTTASNSVQTKWMPRFESCEKEAYAHTKSKLIGAKSVIDMVKKQATGSKSPKGGDKNPPHATSLDAEPSSKFVPATEEALSRPQSQAGLKPVKVPRDDARLRYDQKMERPHSQSKLRDLSFLRLPAGKLPRPKTVSLAYEVKSPRSGKRKGTKILPV